jgi:hypothetical protein
MVIEGPAASQSRSRSDGILRRRGGRARISLGEDDIARFIVGMGDLMKHAIILAVVAACSLAGCATPPVPPASPAPSAGKVTLNPPGSSVAATFTPSGCYTPGRPPGRFLYSGGAGDRLESAILIDSATSEANGNPGEYAYVVDRLAGWKVCGQALVNGRNRIYDRLDLQDSAGTGRSIYFDITPWFGKF